MNLHFLIIPLVKESLKRMQRAITIDAFPAFNEIDLAIFRIEYLDNLVDKVIIAESSMTHSGRAKPLFFSDWFNSIDFLMRQKVQIISVPLEKLNSSWDREIFTREYLANYLCENFSNSFFILSDLDEIPSIDQVLKMQKEGGIFHFKTPTSYRRANWLLMDSHKDWKRGVMGEVSSLSLYPNGGRFASLPELQAQSGAHFSYFASDHNSILQKYRAFAHEELNNDYLGDQHLLNFCNKYRIDHLGRCRNEGFGVFKIASVGENSVIDRICAKFPDQFDSGLQAPLFLSRLYASIWLSSYIRPGFIGGIKRRFFDSSLYFSKKYLWFIMPPMIEIIITSMSYFRFRMHTSILLREKT